MKALIVYIILGISLSTFCQDFRLKTLTSADGLSQNSVNDIYQDKDGMIWIATQDGLNMYDGFRFKHFRYEGNESVVHDNFIIKITEDDKNNLWLTHRKGVTVFSKQTHNGYLLKTQEHTSYQPIDWITNIDGDLYLINNKYDLYKAVWDNGRYALKHIDVPSYNGKIISISKFSGTFYIVTTKGLLVASNVSEPEKLIPYPTPEEHHNNIDKGIAMDGNGNLFFTTNKHLYRYDIKHAELNDIKVSTDIDLRYTDLCWDNNALWVSTDHGVFILEESLVKYHLPLDYTFNGTQNEGKVLSILKDQQGQIWMGTTNNGVSIYNSDIEHFKFLNHGHGIEDPVVWAVYQDAKHLLLGTNSGLEVFKTSTPNLGNRLFLNEVVTYQGRHPILGTDRISTITKIDHQFWIGAESKVYVFDQELRDVLQSFSIDAFKARLNWTHKASSIVTNIISTDDRIFILTQKGAFYLNKHTMGELNFIEGLEKSHILDASLSYDQLWLATNKGLIKLNTKTLVHKAYVHNALNEKHKSPSHQIVTSVTTDSKGNLWLGTAGEGINSFNPKSEVFNNITESDGLANNTIMSLQVLDSILWISHNKGISSYNTTDGSIRNYDMGDGLVFDEFAINSSFQNDTGELWFGSANGLCFIPDYSKVQTDTFLSKAEIYGLEINYNHQDLLSMMSASGNLLELHPNDKIISFDVNVLDYKNLGIKMEYQLLGFGPDWIEVENNNRITFTNLLPGNYTLKIRAINKHGTISPNQAELRIYVSTPLWKRPWFVLTAIITTILVSITISRYLIRKKYKSRIIKMEQEKKLLHEKQRISRDLHDNVGANLSYIVHSLDNFSYQLKEEHNELSDELLALGHETRGVMSSLRETIWAVKKEHVTLQEIQNRIMDFATKLLSSADMELVADFQTDEKIVLTPFTAINMFRIIQEAVNNAVKHSEGKTFYITLISTSMLKIEMKDDGKSFDANERQQGKLGLDSMKDRANDIGGSFSISSDKNHGTTIIVEIPVFEK